MVLNGKVAWVTGAARGIGRSIATHLATAGATVLVTDIDLDEAENCADAVRTGGGMALACRLDVSNEYEVKGAADVIASEFGRLDVLVNNAAAMNLLAQDGDILSMSRNVWENTFAVNALGTMLCTKYAVALMVEGDGGSVINMSSASARGGELAMTAYSASKTAVAQLTRSTAVQWGKSGIRCNAVSPGLVVTGENERQTPQRIAQYLKFTLTPDVGSPDDVASLTTFLASDDARYITGQVISVDGGLMSHVPVFTDSPDWERRIRTTPSPSPR